MKAVYGLFVIILFSSFPSILKAQSDTTGAPVRSYEILLWDSPQKVFTMRQLDQDYLSIYRLYSRELNSLIGNETISRYVQLLTNSLLFLPFTHEEGHRSILTALNIGAISSPYYNHGYASVIGVTDKQLKDLRESDLPNYIRLHTAGLESDYMLTKRVETLCAFDEEEIKNIKWEYWLRKFGIMQYYLMGLFHYNPDIVESANELERDIVGFDTYGAIRHLYRPKMNFSRYTNYRDLSKEEKAFVDRIGYRSFLNLLNPVIVGKSSFALNDMVKLNFGLGYTMVPFGDMIEENFWLSINREVKIYLNINEFQNKNTWFCGGGINLFEYPIYKRIDLSLACNVWNQPRDLDFNTSSGEFGYSAETDMKYKVLINDNKAIKFVSLNVGFIHKSKGFLPEEVMLKEHTGFRFGASFGL